MSDVQGSLTEGLGRRLVRTGVVAMVWPLLASCWVEGSGPEIDLSTGTQPIGSPEWSAPPRDQLVLAVAAVNSPMSTFDAYSELARYLGELLGVEAKFVGGKTYAEINSLVRSGAATVAIVCSGAYVSGHDEFNMELLAAPIIDQQPVYYSYLIVHKDSPIASWKDLKGHTFAFTDPLSNSGRLVPLYQLWLMGETPESLFSRYIFTYSHDNSIRAVAGKLVDAASVDSLVYDYAMSRGEDEAYNTRVIWRSPPYGINPVVVNPDLEASLKAKLREFLLEMHNIQRPHQALPYRTPAEVYLSGVMEAPQGDLVQSQKQPTSAEEIKAAGPDLSLAPIPS